MRAILTVSALLLVAGCQPPPETEMEPERTAQEIESAVDDLRTDWQSMANADDAAGVAALYASDAVLIDPYGNVHNGRDAIQGYFTESFATASSFEIQTTDLMSHGDMVVGYGSFDQTVQGPEGDMTMTGMWQTVSMYQPDGSILIRLHQSMLPAEPPEM